MGEGRIITANTDRELVIRLETIILEMKDSLKRIEDGVSRKADRETVSAIDTRSADNEKRISALERKVAMAIGGFAVVELCLKVFIK